MQFGFLGIDYRNADLTIRDRTAFTDALKLEFFRRAEAARVDQCMVLSTCNRSEVYYFYEKEEQREEIRRIYGEMFPDVEVKKYLSELTGEEAMGKTRFWGR